ncbi:MAG: hypothetical protein IPL78_09695 [Chloroflexi bacterium]|nr:hypothetical protein [Chloroflexota bacterium]
MDKFFTQQMIGRDEELDRLITFAQPLWEGRFAGVIIFCMAKQVSAQIPPHLHVAPNLW